MEKSYKNGGENQPTENLKGNLPPFKKLIENYQKSKSPHLQAAFVGFTLHEMHASNPEYHKMINLDNECMSLYYRVDALRNDIEFHLKPTALKCDSPDKKKQIGIVIASHEERIEEYKKQYYETGRKLAHIAQQFGYHYFDKAL